MRVVPRAEPPVGTRGRPLRLFLASFLRGRSQLWVEEVEEKGRKDRGLCEEEVCAVVGVVRGSLERCAEMGRPAVEVRWVSVLSIADGMVGNGVR